MKHLFRNLLPAAAAAALAFAPAAQAEPVEPVGETYAGFTCGFVSGNDPSGQVVQDPNTQTGEVNAGPWAVAGADEVTINCTISVGDGVIGGDGDVTVSQSTPGSVGVLASPIVYQAGPGVSVWLCTQVNWTYVDAPGAVTGGGGSWPGFTTDPDGNPYCDEAISVEA